MTRLRRWPFHRPRAVFRRKVRITAGAFVWEGTPMATCPNCGYRKLGMSLGQCDLCGRPVCKQCAIPFASKESASGSSVPYGSELAWSLMGYHRAAMFQASSYFETCSWECFDRWARQMFERGDIPSVRHDRCTLVGLTLSPQAAQRALERLRDRNDRGNRGET